MDTLAFTAGELAERFGLELRGNAAASVAGVATLANAGHGQLAFLSNPHYRNQLADSAASIVVLRADAADAAPGTVLIARDPYTAFARIAALFEPKSTQPAGIHPSAVIDPSARVSPEAHDNIGPGCVIGEDCSIGEGCELIARVTLVTRVTLGRRVRIHPGAVLGADGFGLAMDAGHWIKVPQLGGVRIGDDGEIGANTCIDRGAIEDTELAEDVRLDNLIQIGQYVRIGAHTAIAGCAAVAGSAKIGRYCLIGGAAGVVGHLEICDKVTVTAMSLVTHSIHEPGEYSSGTPLSDNRTWRRNAARFRQLDTLARRVNALQKDPQEPEA